MWGESAFENLPGGFLPTNSDPFGSSTQGQQPTRARLTNQMPVTAAMILKAEQVDGENKYTVDGISFSQVTMVGVVRKKEENNVNFSYSIDDYSSAEPIDVKYWLDGGDTGDEVAPETQIVPGQYVRICGTPRVFQGKKSVIAFRIMPVEDFNEISRHLLEVKFAHLVMTKADKKMPQSTGLGGIASNNLFGSTNNSTGFDSGLRGLNQQVSQLIGSCRDDIGMHIRGICDQLKGVPEAKIRQAIDFLSSEGHIYSTIDDDHYRSTDAA